jgi:type VII secretion integral membrane protein EccD
MTRPDTGLARPAPVTEGSQFCRVTVLAPRTRMDLALPVDLTVAELVPMLTELAGEGSAPAAAGSSEPGRPGAWCLAAVAGAELPARATLAGLGVLDGDLLRLRRRSDTPPPPVFDDPVDAVAEAVPAPDVEAAREPLVVLPWQDHCRRVAGLAGCALAGLLAAVALAGVRGAGTSAAPVPAVLAALAAAGALAVTARRARWDPVAAAAPACAAVPLAAATGVAALPGPPGAGHLLLAAALAAAAAAAGLALLGTAAPPLVAVVLAGLLTAPAALARLLGLGSVAGLAAVTAAVAVGLLPLLPRAGVRLAGLPPPVIPTTAEEMAVADQRWQVAEPDDVRYRSRLAHTYLTGLVGGASLAAAAGAVLAAAGGWAGQCFAAAVVSILLLRSRGYVTALTSAAPLVAGSVAGALLTAGLALHGTTATRLAAAVALLALGGLAGATLFAGPGQERSPVLRRAVDVLEAVLVVATFPLALAVLDVYQLVRNGL